MNKKRIQPIDLTGHCSAQTEVEMSEQDKKLLHFAKQVVLMLYSGEQHMLSRYYDDPMEWLVTDCDRPKLTGHREFDYYMEKLMKERCQITNGDYSVIKCTDNVVLIEGIYFVEKLKKLPYHITLLFRLKGNIPKIRYIHISSCRPAQKQYCIKGIDERIYFMEDPEIIYLEAQHNHLLWHCTDKVIETVGSLKEAQKKLSDKYVRIHKGFIIQREHIVCVGRCYVKMDNGESLRIPEKRYQDIKKELMMPYVALHKEHG